MAITILKRYRKTKITLAVFVIVLTLVVVMRPAIATSSDADVAIALESADIVLDLENAAAASAQSAAAAQTTTIAADQTLVLGADATTDDATYQWQMYDPQDDEWADVYGDTDVLTSVYGAKVASALDATNTVKLRAKVNQKGDALVSEVMAVTLQDMSSTQDADNTEGTKGVADAEGTAGGEDAEGAEDAEGVATVIAAAAEPASAITVASMASAPSVSNIAVASATTAATVLATDDSKTITATVRYVIKSSGVKCAADWVGTFSGSGNTGNYAITLPEVKGYEVESATQTITVSAADGNSNVTTTTELADGAFDKTSTKFVLPDRLESDVIYTIYYTESENTPYKIKLCFQKLNEKLTEKELHAGAWYSDSALNIVIGETSGTGVLVSLTGKTGSVISMDDVNAAIIKYNAAVDDYNQALQQNQSEQPDAGTAPALAQKVDLSGFTARDQDFTTKPISANGDTEIIVNYSRNYYKIEFELSGGQGVSDIFVQYGATVTIPNPTRAGYAFDKWTTDEKGEQDAGIETTTTIDADGKETTTTTITTTNAEDVATTADFIMPVATDGLKYWAKWTSKEASYTVAIWIENIEYDSSKSGAAEQYTFLTGIRGFSAVGTGSYISMSDKAIADALAALPSEAGASTLEYKNPAGETVSIDENLAYFHLSDKNYTDEKDESGNLTGNKVPISAEVKGDGSTTLNVYYDRNSYTLRFYYAMKTSKTATTWYMAKSNHGYSLHSATRKNANSNSLTTWGSVSGREDDLSYNLYYGCDWESVGETEPTIQESKIKIDGTKLKQGYETRDGAYFAYIDLTAKYKTKIKDLWPVYGSVKASNTAGTRVINWGTDYYSYYRYLAGVDASKNGNTTEPNIAPYYESMDENIILTYSKTNTDDSPSDLKATATPESATSNSNIYTHGLVVYASTGKEHTWTYKFWYRDSSNNDYVLNRSETIISTQSDYSAESQPSPKLYGYTLQGKTATTNKGTCSSDAKDECNGHVLDLYYEKTTYSITFYNGFKQSYKIEGIPWGTNLANTKFQYYLVDENGTKTLVTKTNANGNEVADEISIADITPANPNSPSNWGDMYQFTGHWWTSWDETNRTGTGDEYAFSTMTMPKSNIIVYAGWELRTYYARFHLMSNPADASGEVVESVSTAKNGDIIATVPFKYGQAISFDDETTDDIVGKPTRGKYKFMYYVYYVDSNENIYTPKINTVETVETIGDVETTETKRVLDFKNFSATTYNPERYSFSSTKPTSDIDIFAVWYVQEEVPITIRCVDESGKQIAQDSTMSAAISENMTNVTVSAPVDSDLKDLQTGDYETNSAKLYIPTASTKDYKIDINSSDKEVAKFVYRQVDSINYAINYWKRAYYNGTPLFYKVEKVTEGTGNDKGSTTTTVTYEPLYYLCDSSGNAITSSQSSAFGLFDDKDNPIVKDATNLTSESLVVSNGNVVDKADAESVAGTPVFSADYDKLTDVSTLSAYSTQVTSTKAIVTETAISMEGYKLVATDSLNYNQSTLVLTLPKDESISSAAVIKTNTIDFYYETDSNTTEFKVEIYKMEYKDGSASDVEYQLNSTMALPASKGEEHIFNKSDNLINIPGYRFNPNAPGSKTSTGVLGNPATTDTTVRLYYDMPAITITKIWDKSFDRQDMTSKEFAVYLVEPDSNSGSSVIEYNYNGQTNKFTVAAPSENSYESSTVIYLPILETLNASDALVSTAGAYYAIWEVDSIDDVVYYSSATPETDVNSIATSISFGAAAHKMAKVNLSGNDVLGLDATTGATSDKSTLAGPAVYVTNYPNYELPSTGGLGEILGCLFGGAVILMTVFAWRLHRRRTRGREG